MPPRGRPSRPDAVATLMELGEAMAREPAPPRQVFCGFDLWLEVIGSGKLKPMPFLRGGVPAQGNEPEGTLKIPILVAGRSVVSLDVTLAPDAFRIAP